MIWQVAGDIKAEKGGGRRLYAENRLIQVRKAINSTRCLVVFRGFVLFTRAPLLQLLAPWRRRETDPDGSHGVLLLEWQTGLRRAFRSRKRETGRLEIG